ncbi:MocR-like pyridoxine biosynthesis transcription factor PdxR [Andreprevotia chitinilytica]|uniref:MocR-like pyridoxine biosynthesis transcription factor PdxR n=1 Tax=Andreprevotia chitinilytica TaxID=396808 RepID=UPI000551F4FB|nr:PLP-dependent aminotransferase family protein [Andreprevotia chitinilytica]
MDYQLLLANFTTDRADPAWSRQRLLYECLRAAILSGTLSAGTRLLATRLLAAELGLARNTVLYAYEQLATEGFVASDRRGTVVANVRITPAGQVAETVSPQPTLSRRAQRFTTPLEDGDLQRAFAPGVPALADFPLLAWRRLMDQAWRGIGSTKLGYGHAAGEPRLRTAIADHLRASRGVVCDDAQVIITDGTQSSLDLCARAFADAGDVVWIENPGYGGALTAFQSAELHTVGIEVDGEGIAPADWQRRPPKLIYVTPSHQYPLGSVLSLARRLSLIEQANAAGALIIEDDYDSEFRRDGPPLPAMQGLVPNAPVLYLGTFSKTMFPALRIGFMVVPAGLVAPLTCMLNRSASRGRPAEQLALAEFMQSGQFAAHLRRMRRLYAQRRDAMSEALQRHLGDVASIYGGSSGMHLAIRLGGTFSDVQISQQALRQGIVARPLSAYVIPGSENTAWNGFILGYAQVPVERMDDMIGAFAGIVRRLEGSGIG